MTRGISRTYRTTESNSLQGYVTSVMDSERGYYELSVYTWNAVVTYIQYLKISSND